MRRRGCRSRSSDTGTTAANLGAVDGASRATRGYLRDRDRMGSAAARAGRAASGGQATREGARTRAPSWMQTQAHHLPVRITNESRTASSLDPPVTRRKRFTRVVRLDPDEPAFGRVRRVRTGRSCRYGVADERTGEARRTGVDRADPRRSAFCTDVRARSSASVNARDRPPGRTTCVSSSSNASNSARRAEPRSMSAYSSASSISRWSSAACFR